MPPANVDINNTQATPMGISITNTNAEALPSNNPENDVSKWTNEPNVVPKIKFTGTPGLKIQMNSIQPIDFFKLFLTDDLINMMITETNRYADQEINKHCPLRKSSRLNLWKPVDHQEMCQFLGILLHMRCVKLPTFEPYWSTNILYKFPMFSKIMPRNRFQLTLRFWHFVDNNTAGPGRFKKIVPIVEHLNNTMNTIYIPDKDLSIDESMMLWRGRLVFRQYIKNKRHKYGIKLYELCEPDGVVMKVRVYSGESVVDPNSLGQTRAVVLDLMEQFLDQRYCLYTDNYYSYFELFKHLIKKKTHNCGTLRSDRKSNPKEVTKSKLKKGEVISRSREGIVVSKWKDKLYVLMISNMHELKMVEAANKRGEKKMKPNMVRDYNNSMSGVDRSDQMVSYYDCLTKTTRWYKKLALHIFYVFVFNAFCLSSKYGTVKLPRLLKFSEIITTHLIGDKLNQVIPRSNNNFHYLNPIPATEKKKLPTKPC